jgi:hypothetical protein
MERIRNRSPQAGTKASSNQERFIAFDLASPCFFAPDQAKGEALVLFTTTDFPRIKFGKICWRARTEIRDRRSADLTNLSIPMGPSNDDAILNSGRSIYS